MKLRMSYALKEGGERDFAISTSSLTGNGRVQQVHWAQNTGKPPFDAVPGTEETHPAELVLLAMGFLHPEQPLLEALGVERDPRGNAKAGAYATSADGVFAAGDARRGQSLIVWAINEGRQCARVADRYLRELPAVDPREEESGGHVGALRLAGPRRRPAADEASSARDAASRSDRAGLTWAHGLHRLPHHHRHPRPLRRSPRPPRAPGAVIPMSLFQTMLVGIGGSLIGGLVAWLIFHAAGGLFFSFLGAFLIVYLIRRSRGGGLTSPGARRSLARLAARTVLITGCSTGIGHATAARLAAAGWTVYATARRPETLAGSHRLPHARARRHRRGLDAGRGGGGAGRRAARPRWSTTPATACPARWRRCRWTRSAASSRRTSSACCGSPSSCCPGCARAGRGTIVNLRSMGGRLVFPGGGAYHATKYAVEALSDALRMEVKGFGIDVVCVEPGLIRTEFGATAAGGVATTTARTPSSTARSRATRRASTRARTRASAAGRRTSRRRSRRRWTSRAAACRSRPRRACSSACGACCATALWDRMVMGSFEHAAVSEQAVKETAPPAPAPSVPEVAATARPRRSSASAASSARPR